MTYFRNGVEVLKTTAFEKRAANLYLVALLIIALEQLKKCWI